MILKTQKMKTKKSTEKNKKMKIKKIMTNHQRMEFRENQLVNLCPKNPLGKLVAIKVADQSPLEMQIQKKEDNVLILVQKRKMGILIQIHLCSEINPKEKS